MRLPPRSTRTDTLFPYTTLFRSEPLKGFRLLGGVMYIDSELTDTTDGAFDGNRAPATPKYNVNLSAEWDVPTVQGLTLTSRAIHSSRSEEHTSELQSLMRISSAVFCLKNKKKKHIPTPYHV